jgi:hypothetical protein
LKQPLLKQSPLLKTPQFGVCIWCSSGLQGKKKFIHFFHFFILLFTSNIGIMPWMLRLPSMDVHSSGWIWQYCWRPNLSCNVCPFS